MRSKPYPESFEWILYVRISDDREGGGLGVKRQEGDGRKLVKVLGGRVLTVCTDNDLTADTSSKRYKPRPDYDRLCRLLRERPGKRGVIAWHTDRLHRTPRELEDFIDLVQEARAEVQTVEAGQTDLTTPSGRMVARQLCAVAKYENEHKSARIRRKVEELATDGKIGNGGPRPYGFRRIYSDDGDRRRIVRDELDPAEVAIVRECAKRTLAGTPLRAIVRDLNTRGVRTSTGKLWSQQALRAMLRSGRIAGLREHNDVVVGKAVWPAIITKDQHLLLRALLDSKHRPPGSRVRLHYLSGFVQCSGCLDKGVKMRVCPQNGKLKYKCMSDTGGCNGRVIGLDDLVDLIDELMIAKLSDKKTLRELAAREADTTDATAALIERIESDERRLELLQESLDEDDEGELPEVVASVRRIRRRLAEARAEMARLASLPSITAESLPDLAKRWRDGLDLDQKQSLMRLFVDKIVIHPGRRGYAKFDPDRVDVLPVRVRGPRS